MDLQALLPCKENPRASGVYSLTGNILDFEDIERFFNPSYPGLIYSPQAPIYAASEVTVRERASVTLKATAAGSANQYQWLKDNAVLPGVAQANYTLIVDLTDAITSMPD